MAIDDLVRTLSRLVVGVAPGIGTARRCMRPTDVRDSFGGVCKTGDWLSEIAASRLGVAAGEPSSCLPSRGRSSTGWPNPSETRRCRHWGH